MLEVKIANIFPHWEDIQMHEISCVSHCIRVTLVTVIQGYHYWEIFCTCGEDHITTHGY